MRLSRVPALKALDTTQASMHAAEYGKWKNWYRGEWLDGIDETHKMVQDYLAWLDDPLKVPQPTIVNSWQGYYHIMHYEGDKVSDVH